MPGRKTRARSGLVFALSVAAIAAPANAATSGNNGTHDPSRIIESSGKFYFCSTGGGCASSADGLAWSSTGLRIPIPSWASMYLDTGSYSGTQGIWAPDLIFYNGKYYIYYSVCAQPAKHAPCLIGLYTTPTLDSKAADYKLTDAGKVANNPPNTGAYQYATIDPAPFLDTAGNLWTSWGSGYGKDATKNQIYTTRLDTSGLPLATDPGYKPPEVLGYGLEPGLIEGSYMFLHGGYYYLFWNSGSCCDGASSTYTVHVARSQSPSGPFTGEKVWFGPTPAAGVHGPGHVGIYSACGVERFTYHYYPSSGGSVLGENELTWDSDGWPVPGAPSTTKLVPCGNPTTGGGSGAGGTGNSAGAGASPDGAGSGGTATAQGGSTSGGGSVADGGSTPVNTAGDPGTSTGGNAGGNAGSGATAAAGAASPGNGASAASDSGCSLSSARGVGGGSNQAWHSLLLACVAAAGLWRGASYKRR